MRRFIATLACLMVCSAPAFTTEVAAQTGADQVRHRSITVDWPMVAKIREEGLQRSRIAETLTYMTDVLGARLTLSEGMTRAQAWAVEEMDRIGLTDTVIEPFMDYGVRWDNEYVSLHLLEPDYQPMVGYPLAHTPGTDGRQVLNVVIANVSTAWAMASEF